MSVIIAGNARSGQFETPPNHARIGYDNALRSASWSASSSEADFPPEALGNAMTVRRWRATGDTNESVTANFSSQTVNYVGIAAHNLRGADVSIEVNGQATASFSPTGTQAIMVLFEARTATSIKLTVNGVTPEIGVLYAGNLLVMERPFFSGHTPVRLARTTVTRPRQSESGEYLSMTRRRRGFETSASWQHLSDEFYRESFDPFVEHATTRPFFFAWNPDEHPDDVVYAWTSDEIRPSYMGIRDLIEVSMSMTAYGD